MKKWEYLRTSLSQLIGHGNEHTLFKNSETTTFPDYSIPDFADNRFFLTKIKNLIQSCLVFGRNKNLIH